jgi:hypothetical protein
MLPPDPGVCRYCGEEIHPASDGSWSDEDGPSCAKNPYSFDDGHLPEVEGE